MNISELVTGRKYKLTGIQGVCSDEVVEFSRIGGMGDAVFHPPGEPSMQDCFILSPDDVARRVVPLESLQAGPTRMAIDEHATTLFVTGVLLAALTRSSRVKVEYPQEVANYLLIRLDGLKSAYRVTVERVPGTEQETNA